MRLTPEQVAEEKKYLREFKEMLWFGEHVLTSAEQDLFDTIEALQQEIEKLKATLADWKYNAKCDADHIAALTADKDEQAGTIMRLANGLKKLRSSLQWLKETIHDLDYKAWAEDNIGKIDALLGGKGNGK